MRFLKILSLFAVLFCLFPVIGSSQSFYQDVVKPMDVREYDLTYDGIVGTGTYAYKDLTTGSLGTLFRDNEDNGVVSGCNGEGCGGHSGIDVPCPIGTPVYSIASGKVIRSEFNSSWGELIVIEHNTVDIPGIDEPVYSCYAHLNTRTVYVDNQINKGQQIGETGNTGNSTGPHLHFQIDRKYKYGTTQEFTSPYWPTNYPPYRTVNEIDVDHTVDSYTYNPMPFLKYKSLVPVGFYSDGWHTNGTSQAFRDAYDSHAPTIGFPFKNGNEGVAHIHYWSITNDPNNDDGVWIQDFRRDTNQSHYGTDGQSVIILNTTSNTAYLVKEGFWGWYKENHGYSNLDYPLGEEFVDQGLTIQRFKNKYLEYNPNTGDINPREYSGGSGSTTLGGAMISTHQVTINSIPQGAEIWNAGTSLGTAPVVDYYYEDYTYYMTAKMTGYDDKDFQFTVGTSDMTVEVNLGSGGGSANPGDPLVSLLAASPSPTYAGQNWQVQFELRAQDDPIVNDTIKIYRSEPNFVNATMMQEWTDVNISANNSQIFATQTETAPAVGTYELTVKIKRGTGAEELLVGTGSTTNPDLAYIEEENPGNGVVKVGEFYPADTVVVVDSTYEFSVQLVEVTGTSSIQISDLRLSLHDTSGTVLYDLGTWYNISIVADGSWTRQDEFVFPDVGQYKLGVRYSNDGTNWIYPTTFLYQTNNPGPPNPKNLFVNDSVNNVPAEPTDLLVNGLVSPNEVTTGNPTFSAIYHDNDYGDIATHYQVQVSTSKIDWTSPYWDSGKIALSNSITLNERCEDITYNGTALDMNDETYYWRIKFWDDSDSEGSYNTSIDSFITTLAVTITTNSNFSTDLVSYWELDEQSGIRYDSHGSNDLVDNNTVGYSSGKYSYAGDFEKSNSEYLSISDASQSGLDISGDMTISAWVIIESQNSGEYFIVNKFRENNTVNRQYALQFRSEDNGAQKKIQCWINQNWFPWNYSWNLNTWYHVVIVFKASTEKIFLYVNSTHIGTEDSYASSINNGSQPFLIGAGMTSNGTI